eukprot:4699067-Pleurochrysis_carterae.AAC.1
MCVKAASSRCAAFCVVPPPRLASGCRMRCERGCCMPCERERAYLEDDEDARDGEDQRVGQVADHRPELKTKRKFTPQ